MIRGPSPLLERTDRGDETLIAVRGLLDAWTCTSFEELAEELLSQDRRHITFDLSSLRLLDARGLGAVVSLYKKMQKRGIEIKLVGVRDQPLAIFRLAHFERLLSS